MASTSSDAQPGSTPRLIDQTNYQDYLLDDDEDEDMMDESDQDYEQDDAYDDDDDDIDEDEDSDLDERSARHRSQPRQTAAVLPAPSAAPPKEELAQQSQVDLRKQIILIQQDPKIPPQEKAKKIQELMTSKWSSRDKGKSTRASLASNKLEDKRHDFNVVLNTDKHMTFHDKSSNIVGCKHYQRAAKLQAHCCGKWYTCRFCHDEVSDHNIIRNLITTMMCMHCSTVQPAGQDCINVDCQKRVAKYYCKECKLWDDDPRKNIYHCYDCGICRIGKGLGQDYFHCKKCNVCMAISLKGRHKCIERNLESDCPICGEYMFTSTTTVIFMPCGHCIHYKCHQEYIQTSYQCPTCFKSLANMTEYFKRIDAMLAQHQMPPEYNKTQTFIYCNDCEKKCYAKFHFLYHKCIHCKGYNTKVLQTSELVEGTTIEGNNAALLASNLVEDVKPEVKDAVSCCGGGSGSVATLTEHQPFSHSNSHHSILSHRSSSTSLHGVSLGSTAPVFSSSSSSLHTAPLLTQHSFGSLPQVFSGHQHIQSHQQNTSIVYPHPYSASNSSNNLIGGPMSLQFQHQHQHQHHHPVTLPPPTAHHHQQQQQNRFSIANRSIMGIGETGSNTQPSFCTSQPSQHPNHQHLQQQQQQQHPQHQQNHHHGYHPEFSSSSSSHQQSHPSNNNPFGQN